MELHPVDELKDFQVDLLSSEDFYDLIPRPALDDSAPSEQFQDVFPPVQEHSYFHGASDEELVIRFSYSGQLRESIVPFVPS